jgi:NAD(P)-dependent dehydrogenase (short-subunit alcohol dehydrogenase family)
MAKRLDGKVAIVTGGARGNGLGIALAMAREGANIALVDLSAAALEPGRQQIEAVGRRCHPIIADVADEAAVRRTVAETMRAFDAIDVLVNNAGVFPFRPIDQFTTDDFHEVLGVNLLGPWLFAKYTFPEMKRRGGGAIVNITSCSGHYGGATSGGSLYDASKAGLSQLTSSLAAEFGPYHIRVNAIAPGDVVTEARGGYEAYERGEFDNAIARAPLGRVGFPDDVGRAAAFLASEDASFITGTTLILDGGAMAVWR